MTGKKQNLKYVISDYIGSGVTYTLFFALRQIFFDVETRELPDVFFNQRYFLGLSIIPFFWLLIFYISGYYHNVFRKSTINEFSQTLISVFMGSVFFYFTVMLDDMIRSQTVQYASLATYVSIQFVIIYLPRFLITLSFKNKIRSGKVGFRTVIVGSKVQIAEVLNELPKDLGNIVIGFFSDDVKAKATIYGCKCLGMVEKLENEIIPHRIEEVIVAYPDGEGERIKSVLEVLYRNNVFIRANKVTAEQLIGQVKLFPSYGTSFVEVIRDLMPPYEENIKRLMDVTVSAVLLILLSPLMIFSAIRVKIGSRGPVFFKQERAGADRKPFMMYKFRSMYVDAENGTPQLTAENDRRITPYGRFMRKYRIDELPQFWNVLLGDMALVGPRPEREFFIKQIIKQDPNYLFLLRVRPGITSLGMVKFGYADNVDKMVERLKYDMIYIKNMSILFDFKIIIYTFRTILTGKGV